MRNQLVAIVILAVLAFVAFGLMAGFVSKVDPRVQLVSRAEQELPVEDVRVRTQAMQGAAASGERTGPAAVQRRDAHAPQVVVIEARPRPGTAPSADVARRLAEIGNEVYSKKGMHRVSVAQWVVELEGMGPVAFQPSDLARAQALRELLEEARPGLQEDLGDDMRAELIEDGGRPGLALFVPHPGGLEPIDAARAGFARTRFQLAFVRVTTGTGEAAATATFSPAEALRGAQNPRGRRTRLTPERPASPPVPQR